jgi:aryl-alcohol dehydrogenase-like predicted oxidoreductase
VTISFRALGGLQVSAVGLGCNNFGGRIDLEQTRKVLDAAITAGINLLDTADVYGNKGGSENAIGELLEHRRDEVLLATKFGSDMTGALGAPEVPRGSRTYIRWAIEGSLRRLRTDVIDLYQYHWPDNITPLDETLGAMNELITEGKVRFIGCSNFSVEQLAQATEIAKRDRLVGFVSLQNEYSLIDRSIESDVLPACESLGIGVLPYFPLASGLLTGKYKRGVGPPAGTRLATDAGGEIASDATFDRLEQLESFASERGLTMVDVAIGALLAQPAVASVIAGATRPEQILANVSATRWTPTQQDLHAIDAIFPPPAATN